MSSFKKKKKAENSLLANYYNNKLTTNNFSSNLKLKNNSQKNTSFSTQSELDYNNDLTCCSLGEGECNDYLNFCIWDIYGGFCHAYGNNHSCSSEDVVCCGSQLPGLNYGDSSTNDNLQNRSLSGQLSIQDVSPSDGNSFTSTRWWKETSKWIMRGNKNLNNNFAPVPCAVPYVYSYSTGESMCPLQLQKVLTDGNPLITMADWSAMLCDYNSDVYCSNRPFNVFEECPIPGDLNGDGGLNIIDIIRFIDMILYPGTSGSQEEYFTNLGNLTECYPYTANPAGGAQANIQDVLWLINEIINNQSMASSFLQSMYNSFNNFIAQTSDLSNSNPIVQQFLTYRHNSIRQHIANLQGMDLDSPL
jgi:hypothetical protein